MRGARARRGPPAASRRRQDEATPTPAQAADRDAVAVQIGEDFTVTYGEVADYYDYIVSMMSYYGVSAPTADADIESYQDEAVDGLVAQKKQLYFAKQLGLDELTADEEAEVQAAVDEEMEYYFDMFRSDAEAEGARTSKRARRSCSTRS